MSSFPGRPVPRAPAEAWRRPVRVEPVPGTPYGLIVFGQPRTLSGPAVAALVAGLGGVLVALVVACAGLVGAQAGAGAWLAGAFAVLAGFLGLAGIGLGTVGLHRTGRSSRGGPSGFGLAVTGLVAGVVALVLTLGSVAVALLLA